MTAIELKNFIRAILLIPRTRAQELTVLDALIDFVSKALTTGIPDWTALLEFNTDGTGAGKFTLKPDTNGKLRYWKTKTDGNIGNQPPTNPAIDEDAFWIEVSPGDGSAIPEWAPKIYGDGLVIVFYDITGTDPSLYKLVDPARPFESTDFEAELAAGKWKKMTSDVGDVLDVVLTGLSTASTANVNAADSILTAIGKLQANKQRTIFKDGSQAMEANLDMNNNKILQVAPATANGEAVNFEQLNAALDGFKPTADARAASVSDDVDHYDEQTIDGVVLVDGDNFLDKDNADKTKRGLWIVRAADNWERHPDADTGVELQGSYTAVTEGTVNAGTAWRQYAIDVTIDVTDLYYKQVDTTVPDATGTTKGIMKLYTDLLASNSDGTVTQAVIVAALNALAEIIQNSTSTTSSIAGVDAYTGVLDSPITAYVKGQTFKLTDVTANTVTNPTLALDGLAAKNIVNYKNAALGIGDFVGTVIVMYDGAAFRMIGGGGGSAATTTFTPAGDLASTNVQNALEELDAEKEPALGYTAADDAAVVHKTGAENIGGVKTFTDDPIIPDEAYGPGWNGVLEPPTKNAVYDKIEAIQFTDEKAQDAVGTILTDTDDIDLDYADATPAITAVLKKQAISSKTGVTAAVDDYVLIGDTSDSDNLKKATVQSMFDAANVYNSNKISLILFNSY